MRRENSERKSKPRKMQDREDDGQRRGFTASGWRNDQRNPEVTGEFTRIDTGVENIGRRKRKGQVGSQGCPLPDDYSVLELNNKTRGVEGSEGLGTLFGGVGASDPAVFLAFDFRLRDYCCWVQGAVCGAGT